MKFNVEMKEVLKNFSAFKIKEQDIKNINKDLNVNLPNPITQTKNLWLKINENVTSKEGFETFQFMNYYIKRIHTTTKQMPSIVFNAVKEKTIWSRQNWKKARKRFYEDRLFKDGEKVLCSSRIKEAEGRTKLISSCF